MLRAPALRSGSIVIMARVYVETSFFSACVTTRRSPRSVYTRDVSLEWWETQRQRHQLFVSTEVVLELSDAAFPGSKQALALLQGLSLLELSAEVEGLAALLVHEKLIPGPPLAGDALHLAAAIWHKMDYVISWNVKHLANLNKRKHLSAFCVRIGLIPPEVVTPDLLIETDDE